MNISGIYFDGTRSAKHEATLVVDGAYASVLVHEGVDVEPCLIKELMISSRLDSVPRSLRFPDGQQFLSQENATIDELIESQGMALNHTLGYRLESYIPLVVASAIGIAAVAFGFYQYAVPAMAEEMADLVPVSVEITLGEETLAQISDRFLLPSEYQLDDLHDYFLSSVQEEIDESELKIDVLFKASSFFGANAFALPGGTIVFTDGLIELSESDEELLAIFLHELGHVKNRHMVKQGLRKSMLTLMIMAITGDLTAATDLATTLPTMLLSLSYSREFETEADEYALEQMEKAGVDKKHYHNIMSRLMNQTQTAPFWMSSEYLSTHPAPDERLQMIESFGAKLKHVDQEN